MHLIYNVSSRSLDVSPRRMRPWRVRDVTRLAVALLCSRVARSLVMRCPHRIPARLLHHTLPQANLHAWAPSHVVLVTHASARARDPILLSLDRHLDHESNPHRFTSSQLLRLNGRRTRGPLPRRLVKPLLLGSPVSPDTSNSAPPGRRLRMRLRLRSCRLDWFTVRECRVHGQRLADPPIDLLLVLLLV